VKDTTERPETYSPEPVPAVRRTCPKERQALLCEAPASLGAAWARVLCEMMQAQGRPIEGGWPGTISEARARVHSHIDRALVGRGLPWMTEEELATATSAAYSRAKRDWLLAGRGVKVPPAARQGGGR
jgi:hypothetical protein